MLAALITRRATSALTFSLAVLCRRSWRSRSMRPAHPLVHACFVQIFL